MKVQSWSFDSFLMPQASTQRSSFGLIVLNQTIRFPKYFRNAWAQAKFRILADGAANHLVEYRDLLPDAIVGDLDSIHSEVADEYRDQGVPLIQDSNPNLTDLDKSFQHLETLERFQNIVVIGGVGGKRWDQSFGNIHFLYQHLDRQIYLISNEAIVLVLDQGFTHQIACHRDLVSDHVGLFPMGGQSRCETQGLQWNLSLDQFLAFGGLVSTSNLFENSGHSEFSFLKVTVRDHPVVLVLETRENFGS